MIRTMPAKKTLTDWFDSLSDDEHATLLAASEDYEVSTYWVTRLHRDVGIHPNKLRISQPGTPHRYTLPDDLVKLINARASSSRGQ